MKTRFVRFVLAIGLAALPGLLQAQPSAHYVPGVEGIKGASLPPPGVYFRDYNYFYSADQVNDPSGNKIGPADLDAFVEDLRERFSGYIRGVSQQAAPHTGEFVSFGVKY